MTQSLTQLVDRAFEAIAKTQPSEADVREAFIAPLLTWLGYAEGDIHRESPLKDPYFMVGSRKVGITKFADYVVKLGGKVAFAIEAKKPSEDVMSHRHVLQAYYYAAHREVQADLFILTSGRRTVAFRTTDTTSQPLFSFRLDELLEKETLLRTTLARSSMFHRLRIRQHIENITRKTEDRRRHSLDKQVKAGEGIAPTPLVTLRRDRKGQYERASVSFGEITAFRGQPTLILADGGQGKTILSTEIVNRINRGFSECQKHVGIFVHCEDIQQQSNSPSEVPGFLHNLLDDVTRSSLEWEAVCVIDGLEALGDDYRAAVLKTARELGRHNRVILTSRYLGFSDREDGNPGFWTIQIDTQQLASNTDGFLETRLAQDRREDFKRFLEPYPSDMKGTFQVLFFLLELFRSPDEVAPYLTRGDTVRAVSRVKPLTVSQVRDAKDDLMLGRYVSTKPDHARIKGDPESVRQLIRETKRHMDELAFTELTGNDAVYGGLRQDQLRDAPGEPLRDAVNPLLRQLPVGRFTFANDTDREFSAARYFAEAINSGCLSVEDAWKRYWSYVENKALWGLDGLADADCRALLPSLKPLMLFLAELLPDGQVGELVSVLGNSYLKARKSSTSEAYNPFEDDYEFRFEVASGNEALKNRMGAEIAERVLNARGDSSRYRLTRYLGKLEYYSSRLLELLVDKDGCSGCLCTEDALVEIGVYDPEILTYVEHGNGGVRYVAREVVKKVGKYYPALLRFLRHDDPEIRKEAAELVVAVGEDSALDDLLAYISDRRNPGRGIAAWALGEMRDERAVAELAKYLFESRGRERNEAVEALSQMSGHKAAQALLEYVRDGTGPGIDEAVLALGNNDDPAVIGGLRKIAENANSKHRVKAARLLAEKGDKAGIRTLRRLLWSSGFDGCWAAHALGELRDSGAIDGLIAAGRESLRTEECLHALARIGGERAIEHLIEHLIDPENSLSDKTCAMGCLQTVRSQEIAESLIGIMRGLHAGRGDAAWALAQITIIDPGDKYRIGVRGRDIPEADLDIERNLTALIEYIANAGNPERYSTCEVLRRFQDVRAVRALIDYLADASNEAPWYAIGSLGCIGDKTAVPVLRQCLKRGDGLEKWSAARALGNMGEEAIDDLLACLSESDIVLVKDATEALGRIVNRRTVLYVAKNMLRQYPNENEHVIQELFRQGCVPDAIDALRKLRCIGHGYMVPHVIHLIHEKLKPTGYGTVSTQKDGSEPGTR